MEHGYLAVEAYNKGDAQALGRETNAAARSLVNVVALAVGGAKVAVNRPGAPSVLPRAGVRSKTSSGAGGGPTVSPASPTSSATGGGGSGQVLRHYTNEAGFNAIQESKMLIPNAKGQVFATEKALNPVQAFDELFIGTPTHAGRGEFVIEFTPRQGVTFSPGKPDEVIHRGTIRFGRHVDVHYAGPNPYQ
jgi:hypothetical protein